ncbi:hypothetical protein PIB30_097855 [Stylosanthes scabra]|uniref:Uncharacterized protein n=1 Tax=Stylosanthes scabra TaxID=79078 RepID=A0ABU6V085_9FABA|nr:hypothetical protein [Stylosanthes scabra]
MGSGIIYCDIEKHEKYEDTDERADSDLAIVKTQRYHFDDEPFIRPLHSIRFDPDRPYELSIESLLGLTCGYPSKKKDLTPQASGPSRRASPTLQYSPLSPVVRCESPSSASRMVLMNDNHYGIEDKHRRIQDIISKANNKTRRRVCKL